MQQLINHRSSGSVIRRLGTKVYSENRPPSELIGVPLRNLQVGVKPSIATLVAKP